MTTETTRNLYADDVNVKPVDVDWFDLLFSEDYELVYPDVSEWTADECRRFLDDRCGPSDEVDEMEADELREAVTDWFYEAGIEEIAPMMNYVYPVTLNMSPEQAQDILARNHTSLTIVYLHGEAYLALAGGGMDFSWEICEAYTLLGQLPPVHFCDLPGMAGRGQSDRDKAIIAACRQSVTTAQRWLGQTLDTLDRIEKGA